MHIRHLPYFVKELINLFVFRNRYSSKLLRTFNNICGYKVCEYSDRRLKEFIFCFTCGDICNQCTKIRIGPTTFYNCMICHYIDSKIFDNKYTKCCSSNYSEKNNEIEYNLNKKTGHYTVKQTITCKNCNDVCIYNIDKDEIKKRIR